jgi:hypothetical protein
MYTRSAVGFENWPMNVRIHKPAVRFENWPADEMTHAKA